MSARPRLLDLYCGAGGAAVGYHQAGFDVVGVDIEPQPNYPYEFIQADALDYLREWMPWLAGYPGTFADATDFDAIHASPPCQIHTTASNRWRGQDTKADTHLDLIPATREMLQASGLPYVIENVPGASAHMQTTLILHGGMFGLGVHRQRLFESNVLLLAAPADLVANSIGVYGRVPDGRRLNTYTSQRAAASLQQAGEAMGIDWMTWEELTEAIPPAYTQFIGEQLLASL